MLVASAGNDAARREAVMPTRATPPITPARNTDGSGRASTTNPPSASAAAHGLRRRGTPTPVQTHSTAPTTIATLDPLTALRWVMPVSFMASVSSSGVSEVSPRTRPGTRPRASAQTGSIDSRSPSRRPSATRQPPPGGRTSCGPFAGESTATTSSPGSLGSTRPVTSSRVRQVSSSQPEPGRAITSTGALAADSCPRYSMW